MKRILLALLGTVGALAALLGFKVQGAPLAAPPGGLPSATAPQGAGAAAAPRPGASGASAASAGAAAAARSYTGSAVQTQYGIVQVAVTVAAGRIDAAHFVKLTAFDQHSQDINSQAGPTLLRETLDAQSAHIDTVSGASYTSEGYIRSLQSALDQAGVK